MARRLLDGAAIVDNWCSLGGAVQGALRFLGASVDAPWVMGISGLAFRLAVPSTADETATPGAETAIDPERVAALIRNLGRKVDVIAARQGDRDYTKCRDETIKRVQRRIDRGVPAVIYDLHLPRFGLVKGYDDRAVVWYVSSTLSVQYGETLPLVRWPAAQGSGVVLAFLLGGTVRIDARRAVLDALRFAVTHAEHGERGDRSGAAHGFAALERWREAFLRGDPISAGGNAALVQIAQSSRRDAARFLRRDATRILPEAVPALARAAAAYDAETLALSRMMTMFPYPSGGDPANRAARVVAAGALREALAQEQAAIGELRSVIEL